MTCIRSPLHRTLKLQAHQEIAQAHYRTTDLQLKFTFKNAPFKKGVYLFNYFDSITVKKRGHFFQRKVFASIRPFVDPPRRQVKKETRQGLSLSEQWLKHSMSDCCSSKGGDPFKAQWQHSTSVLGLTRCLESDDQMLGSERGSTVRTDEQPDLDD